ncbi:MAG: DPP IV N-terminal domain-containing protein, partial [Deltaproteobacteria bacterium]|nr:DPP IV N-terminal domain-containing protein [Deltaproteobacteria bacterium]
MSKVNHRALFEEYKYLHTMIKGGSVQANWMPDGTFWFAPESAPSDEFYHVDPATGSSRPFFDIPRLRDVLTNTPGINLKDAGLPFRTFTPAGNSAVSFDIYGRSFDLDLATYDLKSVDDPEKAMRQRRVPNLLIPDNLMASMPAAIEILSPDGMRVATVQSGNLAIRNVVDGKTVPLTDDAEARYQWSIGGAIPWRGSAKWSPDGRFLAAFKYDNRKVHQAPVVRYLGRHEQVEYFDNAKIGDPWPKPELYFIDTLSGEITGGDMGVGDYFSPTIGFTPDGSELLLFRNDMYGQWLELRAINVRTGKARSILREEKNDTFTSAPYHLAARNFSIAGTATDNMDPDPAMVGRIWPLSDGERSLWISDRSGWRHLYMYDMNGNCLEQLTSGDFPVAHIDAVDEDEGWVYFTAGSDQEHAYDLHLCRSDFEGTRFEQLTRGRGIHASQFAPNAKSVVINHSSLTDAPSSRLLKGDGTVLLELETSDVSRLEQIDHQCGEEFVVKAKDGKTDIYGGIFKPNDFDPLKKYPIIEVVYAGCFTCIMPRDFMGGLMGGGEIFARAQRGYIMVQLETQGTPGRSKAFHDVIHTRGVGIGVMGDHRAAIEAAAKTRHWMDVTRVGVTGSSYGGYHTIRALLEEPDFYKVGVASAPAELGTDCHQGMIEPYLGPLEKNMENYENSRLAPLAG